MASAVKQEIQYNTVLTLDKREVEFLQHVLVEYKQLDFLRNYYVRGVDIDKRWHEIYNALKSVTK